MGETHKSKIVHVVYHIRCHSYTVPSFRLYDLLSNEENDDDEEDMEIANLSGGGTASEPINSEGPKKTNTTVMRFNNYTNREFSASSSPSTSEDEEEVEQKRRLELKNPMFPKI